MKRIVIFSIKFTFLLLFSFYSSNAQNVEIYHGLSPSTKIIKDNTEKEFKVTPESIFKIRINNPNPHFYTYSFKIDTTKLIIESPNFTELITLLEPELLPEKEDTEELGPALRKRKINEAAKREHLEEYTTLLTNIDNLENIWKKLNKIINDSDIPYPLPEDKSKYVEAKAKVNDIPDQEIDKDVYDNALIKAKEADEKLKKADKKLEKKTNEKLVLALKHYAESLVNRINTLKKNFISHNDVIEYEVKVKAEQKTIIYLTIKKRGDKGVRQLKEKLIKITLIPNYKGSKFEIIPLGTMIFSDKVSRFGLEGGIITETETQNFPIRPGMLFNFNIDRFGERDLNAIGIGLGTSISPKGQSLNNFQGAVTISFADKFRMGIGIGYTQAPVGLKEGNQVGNPVIGDIENIEDIIEYDKRIGVFLNFSIFGLDVPSLFKN